MKICSKFFAFAFLACLVLFLTTGEAYADDVLQQVRDKAAKFLYELRPVIFILAGFGLIGFAWMAIFNKISWKWFANIAMGLFLVANMGLFVDYFATKSGAKGQYAEALGYGKHLKPGYNATAGTNTEPQKQEQKDNTTDTKNDITKSPFSDSEDFEGHKDCVPSTGVNCITGEGATKKTDTTDILQCTTNGGVWNNDTLKCETKKEVDKKAAIMDPTLCTLAGGLWKDGQCT